MRLPWDDSDIAASTLKRAEIYPDSGDGDDRITFTYNRQREINEIRDQHGTVHRKAYDRLGREIEDCVSTLGEGVCGRVRRIGTTYEVRGMREKVTSYWTAHCYGLSSSSSSSSSSSAAGGEVVNEVLFAYNDFGQLTHDYQSHSGPVNVGTTPKVQYSYADGSNNTVRPTGITYPDGRELTYDYPSGSVSDAASRIASLIDDNGSTHLADYSYLGRDTFVEVDYHDVELRYTLVGTAGGIDPDTGDIYRGLDRFGRVKDSYWRDDGRSDDADRIKYGYDRAGNRTWRDNPVDTSDSFDEKYLYDVIHRLKTLDRGELNVAKEIVGKTFGQCWSLDPTGNWKNFREDDDGNGVPDLNQQRTANEVNEITDITESAGPSWITPAYNRAGNMTTVPKPADPTAGYKCTYDAWNRLVKVLDAENPVAEYEYDGVKRRTVKRRYSGGAVDETRHFYYTEPAKWQVIEERVNASNDAERQFVWGQRYVDDLVLRDRDKTGNGIFNERLYGLQDANWNLTSVAGSDGAVLERYAYSGYGVPRVLTPSFAKRDTSDYGWEIRFAGYRLDLEIDLYHVRNRVYAANLGVWLQRDPLGYNDSPNVYEYVSSRPIDLHDWNGLATVVLESISIGGFVIALLLAILIQVVVWETTRSGEFGQTCTQCAQGHFNSLRDAWAWIWALVAGGACAVEYECFCPIVGDQVNECMFATSPSHCRNMECDTATKTRCESLTAL